MGLVASAFRRRLGRKKKFSSEDAVSDVSSWSSGDEDDEEDDYDPQEIGALAWEGLFALVCYEIDMLRPKTVVDINREIAEAAEMEYAKEEAEAVQAEAEASKEWAEYEEARERMEKEREEMEEAEAEARREQEEAEEAERRARIEQEEAEEAARLAQKELEEAEEAERNYTREEAEAVAAERAAKAALARAERLEQEALEAEHEIDDAILQDEAIATAQRLRAMATDARQEAEVAQKVAEKERAEADEAQRVAAREREEADAAVAAAAKELEEAEEARRIVEKERQEAHVAKQKAVRERLEYEEALVKMRKEEDEAIAAQARADKERREADEARARAEQRRALFEISNCIAVSDTAKKISSRAVQIVPDDHDTLEEALAANNNNNPDDAGWGSARRILVRRGDHNVSHGGAVELKGKIELCGDEGAVLHGTLMLVDGGSGSIRGLQLESSVGPAVWGLGGEWTLDDCRLLSSSRGKPSVLCDLDARMLLSNCTIGGKERGMKPFAGLSALGRCLVEVRNCRLGVCGSCLVLMQETAELVLSACKLSRCASALMCEVPNGVRLAVEDTLFDCDVVWGSSSRPSGALRDQRNSLVTFTSTREGVPIASLSNLS